MLRYSGYCKYMQKMIARNISCNRDESQGGCMQDEVQEEEHTIPEMVDNVRAGNMDRRTLLKRLALMGLSAAGAGAIAEVAARQIAPHTAQSVPGDNNGQLHIQQHN